jgi:hypothetical protein
MTSIQGHFLHLTRASASALDAFVRKWRPAMAAQAQSRSRL